MLIKKASGDEQPEKVSGLVVPFEHREKELILKMSDKEVTKLASRSLSRAKFFVEIPITPFDPAESSFLVQHYNTLNSNGYLEMIAKIYTRSDEDFSAAVFKTYQNIFNHRWVLDKVENTDGMAQLNVLAARIASESLQSALEKEDQLAGTIEDLILQVSGASGNTTSFEN